ncbi:MAG: hypothetical protein ABI305_07105 [Tepidiformaceae bacterium]
MVSLFGLFRTVAQLLQKRRESADAQWVQPGNDITRAVFEGPSFELPAERHVALPVVAEAPAIPTQVEMPAAERAAAAPPVTQTEQPAAEEQGERPAKRRRWHRAA